MRFHKHNVGVMLAILAGLLALGTAVWPITPQARVASGEIWLAVVFGSAVAFLAAAFFADRAPVVSRILLIGGALALAASGSAFATLFGGGEAFLAAVIDLAPAIVAAVAGLLIGPMETSSGTV